MVSVQVIYHASLPHGNSGAARVIVAARDRPAPHLDFGQREDIRPRQLYSHIAPHSVHGKCRIRAGAGKVNPDLGQIQPSAGVKSSTGHCVLIVLPGGLQGWTVTGSNSEQWVLPCPNPTIVCKMTPVSTQSAPTTAPLSTQNDNKDTCNSEVLSIGMLTQVEQENLLVIRSEPYIGSVLGHAGPMSVVTIVGGPACAGGAVWWEVNVASLNLTGWAAEANLRACSKEDGCT